MSMRVVAVAFGLMVVVGAALMPAWAAEGPPVVFWYSDPVKPGELVMLQGANLGENATVEFMRIADGKAGAPQAAPADPGKPASSVVPMQASDLSVKAVVPGTEPGGIFACRVKTEAGVSKWQYLNAPQPWWQQGDVGAEASPGGWLRIFGRCLSFENQAMVVLRAAGKPDVTLPLAKQECWSLYLELPSNLSEAEYVVWVHNGYGGPAGWREAGTVKIAAHAPFWKTERFSLTDYGAVADDDHDDTLAMRQALEAAAANGGGIVYVPRGRFNVHGSFDIPQHTLIQGAAANLSLLEWADMPQPPEYLLKGKDNFSIQDLSIFVLNHMWGIVSEEEGAGNIWLRRLHIRMERTLAISTQQEYYQRRPYGGTPAWGISLPSRKGDNMQVTDCDLTTDAHPIQVFGSNLVVARNRVYSTTGQSWIPGGGRNYIYEDNESYGVCVGYGGNNVYFARNRVRNLYTGFRELNTTDSGGGCYLGKITASQGTELTLAEKMNWMWGRTKVLIMEGTGRGQYRELVAHDEQHLTVDRPWEVPPDETSVIAVTPTTGKVLAIENDMADGSVALALYGGAYNCVMAGNQAARSTGFISRGMHYNGPAPSQYVQWLDNRITEGYGIRGQEGNAGDTALSLVSGRVTWMPGKPYRYNGPLLRAQVVRGNRLEANAYINIFGAVADVIIEGNTVRESRFGIAGGTDVDASGIVLRNNRFEAVDKPLGLLGKMLIHPAEHAAIGLEAAANLLGKGAPAAWERVRQDLASLQAESLAAPELLPKVQACVNQAVKALPPGPHPPALARFLLGMDLSWYAPQLDQVLYSGAGGSGGARLTSGLPAWAPAVEVGAQMQPVEGWEIVGPVKTVEVKPGTSVFHQFALTVPPGTWGLQTVQADYTFRGPEWELQASEKARLGSGRVMEWCVVGPFPNESGLPLDTTTHGPAQRLDLGATYDSPAGPLKWKQVSSKDLTLNLKELLGDGKMQVGYGVTVLRAARAMPVEVTVWGPQGVSVYVNRRLVIESTRRWRTQAAMLEPGDNVLVCVACSAGSDWSLGLQVEPLEEVGPGDLTQVPAAEMPAVRALRSADGPTPEGKGLPLAAGQDWRLVYQNNFDWPRVGSEWEQDRGTWTVEDEGFLRVNGYWPILVFRKPTLPPVRVEYDLRPMQSNERRVMAVGLSPAGKATQRWLWGTTAGFGYFLTFGWHDTKTNQVWREEKPVVVSEKAPYPETGKWHHVIVQFVPPKAQMYVDGELALEYSDPEWLPDLDTISFFDWPGPTDLDNIRIYSAARE